MSTIRVSDPRRTVRTDVVRREPGRYAARLASTLEEVDAALRLRFEVFNVERGEGLARSFRTGRDEDEFDTAFDHLIVCDGEGAVVGTYRLQTAAAAPRGLYVGREFDLSAVPAPLLAGAVELGRACIAPEHRNTRVLLALWRGIADYVARHRSRYLLGCCSLPGTDPALALESLGRLRAFGLMHDWLFVEPMAAYAAAPGETEAAFPPVPLPPLFAMYLRYGARVCSGPAIDREFGTTDFLVLLDVEGLDRRSRVLFFGDA